MRSSRTSPKLPNKSSDFDQQLRYYQFYSCYPGCGAVFELTQTQGTWTKTDLYDFPGGGNGGEPMAGVILDNKGNIYGTASKGGNNWGTTFELKAGKPPLKPVMLHNFCSTNNCADGGNPVAALTTDSAGALYGTTYGGGKCVFCTAGVVFKLTPSRIPNVWNETVLHRFQDSPDGGDPATSVILDTMGNIHGTTVYGGGTNHGTVFAIAP